MSAPSRAIRSTRSRAVVLPFALAGTFVCGCGFVLGGLNETRAVSKPQGCIRKTEATIEPTAFDEDRTTWVTPGWSSLTSIAVACGLAATIACGPAVAQVDMETLLTPPEMPAGLPDDYDALQAAREAKQDYEAAKTDKRNMEKETRLRERLSIREVAREKDKADEIITTNLKNELSKIAADKEYAIQAANDRLRDARDRAVEANKFALDVSEQKRKDKVIRTSNMAPANKVLTTALAEKSIAEEEAMKKKVVADNAVAMQDAAEKLAADKKAEVERAVLELSKIGVVDQ